MDRREFLRNCALGLSSLALPSRPARGARIDIASAAVRVRALAQQAGCAFPLRAPWIRVEKERRTLILGAGRTVVARYPVGLGSAPVGHKARAGDHRTPEGRYFVCTRNAGSRYHLFLGISYPNVIDARAHRLDPALVRRIERAERERGAPPWDTTLGGTVGIHGGGAGVDWTWGCVALDDAAIEELWVACPIGTPIEIVA